MKSTKNGHQLMPILILHSTILTKLYCLSHQTRPSWVSPPCMRATASALLALLSVASDAG